MSDKIDQIATTMTHTGAGVALGSFFSLDWWNANSAGILAICGAVGAFVSVLGFVLGQVHKRRKPHHSEGGVAILPMLILFLLISVVLLPWPVWADTGTTEHNEQHAAEMAAQNALFDAGCIRTNITRSQRYSVAKVGEQYQITGNGLIVECVKWQSVTGWRIEWTAPTTREDGSKLPPDQIAGYQVVSAGEVLAMVSGTQYLLSGKLPTILTIRTVDNLGLVSRDSDPVVLQ